MGRDSVRGSARAHRVAGARCGPHSSTPRSHQSSAPAARFVEAFALRGWSRMITLALDASTYVGDVALLDGDRVVAEAHTAMKGADEERLMPAVARVLSEAGVGVDGIDRVVCGAGPGSFTSLRIAGAIAKGIAMGVGCPLYAVPSMALVVGGGDVGVGRFLVAIDALRGELYVGLFDVEPEGTAREIEPARLVPAEVGAHQSCPRRRAHRCRIRSEDRHSHSRHSCVERTPACRRGREARSNVGGTRPGGNRELGAVVRTTGGGASAMGIGTRKTAAGA